MNLQFESIRSYIKTGAPYDDDNQIVKNIMFDIDKANFELGHKNTKQILKLEAISNSTRSFKPRVDTSKYNRILEDLSGDLFDVFRKSLIKTELHAEWKEYFHCLYDLIVIDAERLDPLYLTIVLKETYKYWNTLPVPETPKQSDKLYSLIFSIRELFNDLEDEHFRLTDDGLSKNLVAHLANNTEKSRECCKLNNQIRENEKVLDIYQEILQWSKK